MAFHFPLGTLLRLKEIAEEREERLLGQILSQLAKAKATLADLQGQHTESIRRREAELQRIISATELHVFYGEMRALEERQQHIQDQIQKLEMLRGQQMKAYETAHQARELLSNMREEQLDKFRYEQARREQNTQDDNFSSRRARR
jgi:flagellar export protein FliJ